MIRSSFLAMLATWPVCSFCGKEFIMLGRHTWQCKERLNQNPSVNTVNQIPVMHSPIRISNTNDIKCCCGKSCKGTKSDQDLSSSITHLNNVVYNYFADNFGHVEKIPDKELVNRYKDQTVKDLKKSLKQLKLSNADPCETKYVSRTLRDKLRISNSNSVNNMITRDQSTPPQKHSITTI